MPRVVTIVVDHAFIFSKMELTFTKTKQKLKNKNILYPLPLPSLTLLPLPHTNLNRYCYSYSTVYLSTTIHFVHLNFRFVFTSSQNFALVYSVTLAAYIFAKIIILYFNCFNLFHIFYIKYFIFDINASSCRDIFYILLI